MAVERPRRAPPQRSHAQHFLRSTRLAAEIVRAAEVPRDTLVLDIGAGTGVFAGELARCCDRVRAIEIDGELAARLRARFASRPRVEVVHADALRLPLPHEPFRVVANVPFNRTTAICRRLLDDPRVPLERADLVVALEVAWKRARVTPSTALGAYWGAWYEFALAPPPQTDAGVLRINPPGRAARPAGRRRRLPATRDRGVRAPHAAGRPLPPGAEATRARARLLDGRAAVAARPAPVGRRLAVRPTAPDTLRPTRTPLTRSREAGKESDECCPRARR